MKLYDKVILLEDYTNEYGYKFVKDQTGVIAIGKEVDGYWAVEFDGYDEMKGQAKVFKETYGECLNIVPWISFIPARILSVMES